LSGNASVSLTNASTGVLDITANAAANATASFADAYASNYSAIDQYAYAQDGDASVSVTNDGAISILASADAAGGTDAFASASIESGIDQYASAVNGSASANVTNTGSLDFAAQANAVAGTAGTNDNASAYAYVDTAITQHANGSTVLVDNSGSLTVGANATAMGDESARAAAAALGIDQVANGASASASIVNGSTGVIDVAVAAIASGDNAFASALALGAVQDASGTSAASVSFANEGAFSVNAQGDANGATTGSAGAGAFAVGVLQEGSGPAPEYAFSNSGTFDVDAVANAAGSSASASAFAGGYGVCATGGCSGPVNLNVSNSGTFSVNASATGGTVAGAVGMGLFGHDPATELLSGIVDNSGTLEVSAAAAGGTLDTATAVGILMESGVNTTTLNNTGTISASAQTTGGTSQASGVLVEDYGVIVPGAGDTFTLNNDGGTIIARESVDGGLTWTRGLAIDTSLAPNNSVINLMGATGDGYIYGNIDISSVDTINVSAGETVFDGIVNPGGELEGTLNILSGGTLFLLDEPTGNASYDGQAAVNVDDFNVAAGGTLAVQLPNDSTVPGSYPFVVSNTADITGATLEIRPSSENGLYADSYTFDDVIDAGTLTGTFSDVVMSVETPLLTVSASYDGADNVDLAMSRVAFGDVSGLTMNQTAVGDGIESVYSSALTGPFATMLGTLFTQDAATYASSLDQLTAGQYAGYLQSLTGLGGRFNGLLGQAGECAALSEDSRACRREGGGGIWGQANYSRVSKDGDVEAPDYKANQLFLALGADFNAGSDLVLGLGAAYVQNDLNFGRYNGSVDSDGFQIGTYAFYQPENYYLKVAASYTDLNGDSRRDVNIGTTAGTITGSPDARIWTLSAEAGYDVNVGGSSTLTPYLGVDYTSAKLKSFTETGVDAANLDVEGGSHNRTASRLGVKWKGAFGDVFPELNLGWRHQFGDRRADFDAAFDIIPGSDFSIVSQTEKRDEALVGVALSGRIGSNVTYRISYQGQFNGDVNSHGGGLTISMPLGSN